MHFICRLNAQDILPLNNTLFQNLFGALSFAGSNENEYVMKGTLLLSRL